MPNSLGLIWTSGSTWQMERILNKPSRTRRQRRCPYRELRPHVAMMQAADHWLGKDAARLFDWSTDRCILS